MLRSSLRLCKPSVAADNITKPNISRDHALLEKVYREQLLEERLQRLNPHAGWDLAVN